MMIGDDILRGWAKYSNWDHCKLNLIGGIENAEGRNDFTHLFARYVTVEINDTFFSSFKKPRWLLLSSENDNIAQSRVAWMWDMFTRITPGPIMRNDIPDG